MVPTVNEITAAQRILPVNDCNRLFTSAWNATAAPMAAAMRTNITWLVMRSRYTLEVERSAQKFGHARCTLARPRPLGDVEDFQHEP
jgi:hypothetical protein